MPTLYSAYSNIASATTNAGGGGEVAGAYIKLQSDFGVLASDGGKGTQPVVDGDVIVQWTEQGNGGSQWFGDGFNGPLYQDDIGNQINGLPVVQVTTAKFNLFGLVFDFDQTSWTFYLAFDDDETDSGDKLMFDTNNSGGGDGVDPLSLFLRKNGNVGFRSIGLDVEVAPSTNGPQVLAWLFDIPNQEIKVFRNGVQIGVTSTDVTTLGYYLGAGTMPLMYLSGPTLKATGRYTDVIAYKTAHTLTEIQNQSAFMMARIGI